MRPELGKPKRERWPPPPEISPAGRLAGYVTGACLAIAGGAFLAAAVGKIACSPATECQWTSALGFLVALISMGPLLAGAAILISVHRRPTDAEGDSGWTWGLAVVFAFGISVIAARLPGWTCPAGYHLDAVFGLCIDGAERFDATSWVWAKRLVTIAGLAVALTLIRRPSAARVSAPAAAAAWAVGLGWLLLDTVGGEVSS
jgi:hypothetical protein